MVSLEIKNEVAAQPQLKWTYGCTLNISNLSKRKVVILTHCLATKFLVIFKVTHFCLYKGKFFESTLICEIFFQEIWLKAYEKGLFLRKILQVSHHSLNLPSLCWTHITKAARRINIQLSSVSQGLRLHAFYLFTKS